MKRTLILFSLLLCWFCISSYEEDSSTKRIKDLMKTIEKIKPLHKKLAPPGPNDWLAYHDEPGQTFLEYTKIKPLMLTSGHYAIYIQPIGEFSLTQRKIINLTAEFLNDFFNLPVKANKDISLSVIPPQARRTHPSWGMQQILTTYVLEQILIPNLASDAAAFLALTTSDLWPAEGWNFVFGQAYIEQHVGVWSLYRNGDPHKNRQDFNLCLIRTLKTAAHETGHIFSIEHCIKYECVMNGSNHREESDSHPLEFCPECLAKVCWITGADIKQRYKKLAGFCRRNSLTKEAELYDKSINVLKEN